MSAEYHSHKKTYIFIFVVLAVLTVLELLIPELLGPGFSKASTLTVLAVGKAVLVAYFFMHLNEETRWLKFVASIPIFAALYTTVVALDALYR